MATGATFQDSQGTDFIGNQVSLMERVQRMRNTREDQNMQRAEFQAKLPVIQAVAQANIATAKASIANATRMEQLRIEAAAKSSSYNDRFLNIMMDPESTPTTRSESLAILQGEIGWMDNPALPEYKGFVEAVNNARAQTFTTAITNMKLDEALGRAKAAAEGRVDVATINAGARTGSADTRAASQERVAQINADTRLSVEDKRGRIAAERQGATLADLQSRAAQADQAAADAAAGGDERAAAAHRRAAASYRDAITSSTTDAGYAPSAPRDAKQDPRPSPTPSEETQQIRVNADGSPTPVQSRPASAAPSGKKLYVVSEETKIPAFAPDVKTPKEVLSAVQQMTDDGVITPEQARQVLIKLKFQPKQ